MHFRLENCDKLTCMTVPPQNKPLPTKPSRHLQSAAPSTIWEETWTQMYKCLITHHLKDTKIDSCLSAFLVSQLSSCWTVSSLFCWRLPDLCGLLTGFLFLRLTGLVSVCVLRFMYACWYSHFHISSLADSLTRLPNYLPSWLVAVTAWLAKGLEGCHPQSQY